MTTTKSLCALAAASAVLAAASDAAAGQDCAPAARLSGEPALVASLEAALRARGVATRGEHGCPAIEATAAAADGERVRLTIRDTRALSVERLADDLDSAATLIESWARSDLAAPLLAARSAPPVAPTAPDAAPPVLDAASRRPAGATRRVDVIAALEATLGEDRSVWRGAAAGACVRLGRVCAGALIRYAETGNLTDESSARNMLDVYLTAQLAFTRGRWTLSPGVALGQSAFESEARRLNEEAEDSESALTARATVDAGYRFAGAWRAQLTLAAGASDFDNEEIQGALPLTGAPMRHAAIAVGLRYGGL